MNLSIETIKWDSNDKLTKTEEDGIDRHVVDAENQTGNEVSAHTDGDNWDHVIVGGRQIFIDVLDPVCEDIEGQDAHNCDNNKAADKQHDIRHLVQHGDSYGIT